MAHSVDIFNNPTSVAVVGASDDPDKIGGRPIRYMKEFGFEGEIIAINPRREQVQGITTVPSLTDLESAPDIALIAVPGELAVQAVEDAARIGVKGAIVMSSGFAEASGDEGTEMQKRMVEAARDAGMRLIGPNTQGLANFANGAILGFSTMFSELEPKDGPIAVISQSGAMAAIPFGILRGKGLGVRYVHSSGNDADVSASELAAATLNDSSLKLLVLYLENIGNTEHLIELAEKSREKDIPVVVLVGGSSSAGGKAAASHTGALLTERKVLDAFLERIGLYQVRNSRELTNAAEMYVQGWEPEGRNLVVVSNSGAACVLAADSAEDQQLELTEFTPEVRASLEQVLPTFASAANPIDVTAALLTDSSLFGGVLGELEKAENVDVTLLAIPVAGRGYDIERFAADGARYVEKGNPLVIVAPQEPVQRAFREAGIIVFEDEATALEAVGQFLDHRELMRRSAELERPAGARPVDSEPADTGLTLFNEADSLEVLRDLEVQTVDYEIFQAPEEAAQAFEKLGQQAVVVKGLTTDTSHKSEYGLVKLGVSSGEEAAEVSRQIAESARTHELKLDNFLMAPMVKAQHEGMIGGKVDESFGPTIIVGAGGKYVEALPDHEILIAPCTVDEAQRAIEKLRFAPVLKGVRGEAPVDVRRWAEIVSRVSRQLADDELGIQEFDANPVLLSADSVVAVDGVVTVAKRAAARKKAS